MSSLLEQAIVDATALKEAAYKNAEAAILEKYSIEIKDALKVLLEAEGDDPAALDPNAPAVPGNAPTTSGITGGTASDIKEVPPAATENEKLCKCPEEDEVVEIPLDKLAAAVEKEETEMGGPGGSQTMSREDDLFPALTEGKSLYKIDTRLLRENNQVLEFDKDDLLSVLQEETEFTLDFDPTYRGTEWSVDGRDSDQKQERTLAKLSKSLKDVKDKDEKIQKLKKDKEDLKEKMTELLTLTTALADKVERYENVVPTLKEKLDAFALSNAKLLYTNRVLSNASLNERQKNKIVETLSNAKTPDEAKTIFETLQSAVPAANVNAAPKSLNEAVTRNVISSLSGRREKENTQVPQLERMQILAGIKK
jgi:hypothetical protein